MLISMKLRRERGGRGRGGGEEGEGRKGGRGEE